MTFICSSFCIFLISLCPNHQNVLKGKLCSHIRLCKGLQIQPKHELVIQQEIYEDFFLCPCSIQSSAGDSVNNEIWRNLMSLPRSTHIFWSDSISHSVHLQDTASQCICIMSPCYCSNIEGTCRRISANIPVKNLDKYFQFPSLFLARKVFNL